MSDRAMALPAERESEANISGFMMRIVIFGISCRKKARFRCLSARQMLHIQ